MGQDGGQGEKEGSHRLNDSGISNTRIREHQTLDERELAVGMALLDRVEAALEAVRKFPGHSGSAVSLGILLDKYKKWKDEGDSGEHDVKYESKEAALEYIRAAAGLTVPAPSKDHNTESSPGVGA
jgi:hypothetical protein